MPLRVCFRGDLFQIDTIRIVMGSSTRPRGRPEGRAASEGVREVKAGHGPPVQQPAQREAEPRACPGTRARLDQDTASRAVTLLGRRDVPTASREGVGSRLQRVRNKTASDLTATGNRRTTVFEILKGSHFRSRTQDSDEQSRMLIKYRQFLGLKGFKNLLLRNAFSESYLRMRSRRSRM